MRLLLFLLLASLTSAAQTWQQRVDHHMELRIDPAFRTAEGSARIVYFNRSPDTLTYIPFHLWPNAYRNDRTAFSEQFLENGSTEFYFATEEERGYINRLQFRAGGAPARLLPDSQHQDIARLFLPAPLLPGDSLELTTPFHLKLPYAFSRSGWTDSLLQFTQWYPKPAAYDAKGWHPMPYLDQGEYYNEFGNYRVRITVPARYTVAATGRRTDSSAGPGEGWKTLSYAQDGVTDFALFTAPSLVKQTDTVKLPSGKVVTVQAYYRPTAAETWGPAVEWMKATIRFRSALIGEYPYDVATAVEGPAQLQGGMEYPTITVIGSGFDPATLRGLLAHEVGHNWFALALATHERRHPWMDEGMNSYYDAREEDTLWINSRGRQPVKRTQWERLLWLTAAGRGLDQTISTPSDSLSRINSSLIPYFKAAQWLRGIELHLGRPLFDSVMRAYYAQFRFRHPGPDDFRQVAERVSGRNLSEFFALLHWEGVHQPFRFPGTVRLASPFSPNAYVRYVQSPEGALLTLSPALGRNRYDGLMLGALLTNYKLPPSPLSFIATGLYGTHSRKWNGLGQAGYTWVPDRAVRTVYAGLSTQHFSRNETLDSSGSALFERFSKWSPSVKLTFNETPRATRVRTLELRAWQIGEKRFSDRVLSPRDSNFYVTGFRKERYAIGQLAYTVANDRALYPYLLSAALQGNRDFLRLNLTAEYFYNYGDGGGLRTRAFFSAFNAHGRAPFLLARFQPKLAGVSGEEDYTYSNYFAGRTASVANDGALSDNSGFAAQQIFNRDGGLKLRSDPFEAFQGRSERWVAALNLSTSLPKNLLPVRLPLRLFFDLGTRAESWGEGATGDLFLYTGGLEASLLQDVVHLYAPLLMNRSIRENFRTLPGLDSFRDRITFSVDLHRIRLARLTRNLVPL